MFVVARKAAIPLFRSLARRFTPGIDVRLRRMPLLRRGVAFFLAKNVKFLTHGTPQPRDWNSRATMGAGAGGGVYSIFMHGALVLLP